MTNNQRPLSVASLRWAPFLLKGGEKKMSINGRLGEPLFGSIPPGGNYHGYDDPIEGYNLFPFYVPNLWGEEEKEPEPPRQTKYYPYYPVTRSFSGLPEVWSRIKSWLTSDTGKIALLGLAGLSIWFLKERELI